MTVTVRDNPEKSRYEMYDDEALAGFAEYHLSEGQLALTHTETGEEFGGRGLGKQLVRHVLDEARSRDLAVLPYCPFVRRVVASEPEYVDLVPPEQHGRFELPA